jgi:DNA-binding beta-propeller fold protein YncE
LLVPTGRLLSSEPPELVREKSIRSQLNAPTGVAVDDDGNIYVTESSNNTLLIFNAGEVYTRKILGLSKPMGVAVGENGRIYVCNAGKGNVGVYNKELRLLFKLGSGNGEFELPVAVAVGNTGNLYVADARKDVVKVYRPDGVFLFSFGSSGGDDGKFQFPTSVSIDRTTGEVVVSDLQTTPAGIQGARIQVFDDAGTFKRKFGAFGRGEGYMMKPLGTAVDASGRIYVSDAYQHIVQVFDDKGTYQKTIYDMKTPLRTPLGVAVNRKTGKLYVASLSTSTVEVYGTGSSSVIGTGGDNGAGTDTGTDTMTFSASGRGGCTVTGGPSDAKDSFPGDLLPVLFVLAVLYARSKRL